MTYLLHPIRPNRGSEGSRYLFSTPANFLPDLFPARKFIGDVKAEIRLPIVSLVRTFELIDACKFRWFSSSYIAIFGHFFATLLLPYGVFLTLFIPFRVICSEAQISTNVNNINKNEVWCRAVICGETCGNGLLISWFGVQVTDGPPGKSSLYDRSCEGFFLWANTGLIQHSPRPFTPLSRISNNGRGAFLGL
jgi:hypothetical protein